MPVRGILVVRLGAMGDILHTLPAAVALKRTWPEARLTWAVEPQWLPLLEGNPFVNRVVAVRRKSLRGIRETLAELRAEAYDLAVDFQGLYKSALVARLSGAQSVMGYAGTREGLAALLYNRRVWVAGAHVVDRHLALAGAAGAADGVACFPLPQGSREFEAPDGPFVLASPQAGWRSKQWPAEYYERLRELLPVPLVLDTPRSTSLAGLIDLTRRAAAVVGVDSGPMHLAAALGKPGVAIFGPTDPARNGPYGGSMTVLRAAGAATTYKRGDEIHASMRAISAEEVFKALQVQL